MKILEIEHIKKRFDDLQVLKDISLDIETGEIVSIIGPSGSGKSTLLRCITGLEQQDSGTIKFADNASFGLVFQNFNLFPHMTVLQNITDAPIRVQKRDRAQVMEEAAALLKKMGLEDKADYYPCMLSGGQCQRVAIARALALKPQILFFDEPTSALDPEITQDVLRVIKSLADLHIAMVIVTHEMSFARDISDRIVFMEKGLVVEDGTPDEVFASDNARTQSFLGIFEN